MPLLQERDLLQHEVLEALAAGHTRSALELVTDLQEPYPAIAATLDRLVEDGVIGVVYEIGDETFYGLGSSRGSSR
jgi:hypothetical protein